MFALLALLLALSPDASASGQKKPPNVADVQLPAPSDAPFTFGPGDRFSVTVFKHPDLNADLTVAPDGTITYPLVGRVQIAGRTYTDVVAVLEQALQQYYTDASVAVNVELVSNEKVYVVGEVAQPMVLQITGQMTILEALTRTGGINPDARTDNVLLIRGGLNEPKLVTVDVERLFGGDMSQNVQLQREDIVVVPAKTIVNVERFFRHVQGILAPFVNASQVYRNLGLSSGQGGASSAADGGNP